MKAAGFTLLEMMVAVSIFAIIGVMGFGGLIQVNRSSEQITEVQQQLADIQLAMAYLQRDLSQLSSRKVRDQYGDEQAQFILDEEGITFTRSGWSNLVQRKRSNLQRVEYSLAEQNLVRSYWPELDQPYTENRIDQTILNGVSSFSMHFIDRDNKKIEKWPLDPEVNNASTPVALVMTLELEQFGEIRRIFEITHAIF